MSEVMVVRARKADDGCGRIVRFAPSPNGLLHLGHAYSALLNQRCAAEAGGTVLLRLEDIDLARCTSAYAEAILDDLAWIGFNWQGPVVRQFDRFGLYAAALAALRQLGLAYPCFCTRGDIARVVAARPDWPRDPDGAPLYPGTCRSLMADERAARLAGGTATAWRLDTAAAVASLGRDIGWEEFREDGVRRTVPAAPLAWGDALIARRDVPTSYHLAVVVDDAAQGVTDVVRGEDLFFATALQRLIQALLGYPAPRYHHHRLILGDDGRKLSKSRGAPTLAGLRAAGETPAGIARRLGF